MTEDDEDDGDKEQPRRRRGRRRRGLSLLLRKCAVWLREPWKMNWRRWTMPGTIRSVLSSMSVFLRRPRRSPISSLLFTTHTRTRCINTIFRASTLGTHVQSFICLARRISEVAILLYPHPCSTSEQHALALAMDVDIVIPRT